VKERGKEYQEDDKREENEKQQRGKSDVKNAARTVFPVNRSLFFAIHVRNYSR